MHEPVTQLRLEAPGGIVDVTAECRNGKAERISVRNVSSFADRLDAPLEVEGIGTLTVDTAYGGDSFVIADAACTEIAGQPREVAREECVVDRELGVRALRCGTESDGDALGGETEDRDGADRTAGSVKHGIVGELATRGDRNVKAGRRARWCAELGIVEHDVGRLVGRE